MYKKSKTYEADTNYFDDRAKLKVKCKHCGHTKAIPTYVDKVVCSWCHNYIFRNDEVEQRYRFKEKLLKMKRSEL